MSNAIFSSIPAISWHSTELKKNVQKKIPVIPWRSVLLVNETGVPEENH